MKVSVILPVYNVGGYLEETLQCLTSQSLSDIEIIAINDGSTDNSEAILKKYQQQDSRVSYYNQPNQGQSAARNHALKHATGEYIYFMDSDDKADLNLLQQCYDYAQQTQADFIFFDGDKLMETGANPVAWDYKRTHFLEENTRYDGEELLNLMLDKKKHNCVVWLLFIRKTFLDYLGLRFYEGIIHEDELFTTILTLKSNNIFCLQKSLVHHRVRSTSTMGKLYSKRNINCYLTVMDELFKFQYSPLTKKFAHYTLSKVFYTAHVISLKEKPAVFWRALKSGYLKYIGWKNILVFWIK